MSDDRIYIRVEGVSEADADRYAGELLNAVLDASPDAEIARVNDDASAMSFGATLVYVLGTGAAASVAKGVADWLAGRGRASLTIIDGKKKVIGVNLTSADAVRILTTIQKGGDQ
jgi:hypothetical protein